MMDSLQALRELILSEASIMDLLAESASDIAAADRVYRNEIPEAQVEAADTFHPPKMIVLRQAGGFGKNDTNPIDVPRYTILCYGESGHEADRLRRAVWSRLVHLDREVHGGLMIHTINPSGGVIPLVEPGIAWRAVAQTFTVRVNVEDAA